MNILKVFKYLTIENKVKKYLTDNSTDIDKAKELLETCKELQSIYKENIPKIKEEIKSVQTLIDGLKGVINNG